MPLFRTRSLALGIALPFAFAIVVPMGAGAADRSVSGAALLSSSQSAAARQNSVHVVSTASADGVGANPDLPASVGITTDAARLEGIQHVTFHEGGTSGHEIVEEVHGIGYLQGDAFTLQAFNGFSAAAATRYAGVWLSVTKSDGAFAKLTSGLTMATMPAQLAMPGTAVFNGKAKINGQQVVTLRSTATSSSQTVSALLSMRSRGVPLPVEETFKESGGGSGSDAYSRWNKSVVVTAPPNSTPFSATGQ
jgi:hypothetical protein